MSSQTGESRIINTLREIQKENITIAASVPTSAGATEAKQDDIITALAEIPNIELNTESINLNTDELEGNTKRSLYKQITEEADDLVETYTFYDAGTSDERPNTIVYQGTVDIAGVPTLSTATETYVWAGSSPNFYISTKTLS